MKYINKIFVPLFLVSIFLQNEYTFSQSSDTTYLPSLGDHIFTSITGVDDPFINTKFTLVFWNGKFYCN